MPIKFLKREQHLPISIEEAWDFFSSAHNLNKIKPEGMTFKIQSDVPDKIYPGLVINYRVAPVLNIPLNWTTEITHVSYQKYFVDEQRCGPFNIWHHEHHFEATDTGVMMTDILHYDVGKWILGSLMSFLFVDAKVKWIFDYRFKKLEEIFGKHQK